MTHCPASHTPLPLATAQSAFTQQAVVGMQAPLHGLVPAGQQPPSAHVPSPQSESLQHCVLARHRLLQSLAPGGHWHEPDWQVRPLEQSLSSQQEVDREMHAPLHALNPIPHTQVPPSQ
jgi:hypothetical protein